jgi:hypothetical protein
MIQQKVGPQAICNSSQWQGGKMGTHIKLIAFIVFIPAFAAAQSTWYVPDDFPTIQGAISDAAVLNGDTVIVRQGTYVENLNFSGKAITLTSESGPGMTTIDSDPLFVDPAAGDFHLTWTSPCTNRGINDNAPADDFDGHPRGTTSCSVRYPGPIRECLCPVAMKRCA